MTQKNTIPNTLPSLRDRIDSIDSEIQSLINERARCAQKVAEVKLADQGDSAVFYRPEREAQVLRAVMARNEGPLADEEMARIFRQIMSSCLALEKPMRIAYLGPEGTFTQQAALKHFGNSVICAPMPAIDEVFREVESGAANYGVVPVENSTEGVVNHTLDSFRSSSLIICGEVEQRIHHHLLINSDVSNMKDITHIYSHQQSFAQCRAWLDRYCPTAERIAVNSNAEAAKIVSTNVDDTKVVAAIAGDVAAEVYDLTKLSSNIEDHPDNTTRFLIIGTQRTPESGKDKTSLLVSAKNEAGTLYQLLEPFNHFQVSMTRLETRPSLVNRWEYVFYIDFEGHVDDESSQQVIGVLRERASEVKVLGSYPVAVL